MTDTPPTIFPVDRLERIKTFIGDLARPFAIIVTSGGAAWATVVVAYRVENGNDGAILMGAIFAGVSALYIGRAWENASTRKQAADVEIAKVESQARLDAYPTA